MREDGVEREEERERGGVRARGGTGIGEDCHGSGVLFLMSQEMAS